MRTDTNYEIINHGWDNSQYFQGCGVAFSRFDYVATGAGLDAQEAYQDALDQIYSSHGGDSVDRLKLPAKPRGYGITKRDKVPARANEDCYWYVSVRYSFPKGDMVAA